jgi:hypothetical protein
MGVGLPAVAGTATVYYYTPYKAWSTVYLHHDASGSWTAVPGTQMGAGCANWVVKVVTTGTGSTFQASFNDGQNHWDNYNNQSGANYVLPTQGTHQVKNGQLLANAGTPCVADTQPPSVPTGLTQGAVTTNSVTLSWTASTDNVGVARYEVQRNGGVVGSPTGTSFTDSGLTPGVSYGYTVKAVDAAGNVSGSSSALSVTTPAASQAEVYYYTRTRGWSTVNIHYAPTGGSWTALPGLAMNEPACTDWVKKTLNLGSATGMKAAFNNRG